MSKNLPVPPDLQHLIEKREQDNDRRKPPAERGTPGSAGAPVRPERRRKRDRRRRKSGS